MVSKLKNDSPTMIKASFELLAYIMPFSFVILLFAFLSPPLLNFPQGICMLDPPLLKNNSIGTSFDN